MNPTLFFQNNFLSFHQYAKVSLRYTLKSKPFTYLLLFPLVSVALFWSQFHWNSATPTSAFTDAGLYIWVMTLLLLLTPLSLWRALKKSYGAARFMHAPATYEFSDAGMDMRSPITAVQMSWEAFHYFYDFGRHGVLMTGNTAGFFLDFDALKPPAHKENFLKLLQDHNLKIK